MLPPSLGKSTPLHAKSNDHLNLVSFANENLLVGIMRRRERPFVIITRGSKVGLRIATSGKGRTSALVRPCGFGKGEEDEDGCEDNESGGEGGGLF